MAVIRHSSASLRHNQYLLSELCRRFSEFCRSLSPLTASSSVGSFYVSGSTHVFPEILHFLLSVISQLHTSHISVVSLPDSYPVFHHYAYQSRLQQFAYSASFCICLEFEFRNADGKPSVASVFSAMSYTHALNASKPALVLLNSNDFLEYS